MYQFIVGIASKVIGRLINKDNHESKTQLATFSSVPVATAAALMLIQDGDPVMQMLGYVLGGVAVGLILYKDGSDDK